MERGTHVRNGIAYSGGGGSGVSDWEDIENKPFEELGNELDSQDGVLNYKANFGTTEEFEEFKQDDSVPVGATYRVIDDSDTPSGGGESYSTEEQVIGTWIDGKPLYRKVYTFSSALTINYNGWTTTSIDYIFDRLIRCDGTSNNTCISLVGGNQSGKLGLQTPRNGNGNAILELILEYTKVGD